MAINVLARKVMRFVQEASYINTVNVADRVHVDFVWYPGEANVGDSFVDPLTPAADGSERPITYSWARSGMKPVTRQMTLGRITVPLAPGGTGNLTVFDTTWQISRVAAGVAMDPVANVRGMQQRLNALGYHLRSPGTKAAGVDGIAGRRTENAVLAFEADYRPSAAAAAPANKRLQVRGEWVNNAAITGNLNQYNSAAFQNTNPSAADSAALQAALVVAAGG